MVWGLNFCNDYKLEGVKSHFSKKIKVSCYNSILHPLSLSLSPSHSTSLGSLLQCLYTSFTKIRTNMSVFLALFCLTLILMNNSCLLLILLQGRWGGNNFGYMTNLRQASKSDFLKIWYSDIAIRSWISNLNSRK